MCGKCQSESRFNRYQWKDCTYCGVGDGDWFRLCDGCKKDVTANTIVKCGTCRKSYHLEVTSVSPMSPMP